MHCHIITIYQNKPWATVPHINTNLYSNEDTLLILYFLGMNTEQHTTKLKTSPKTSH